MFIEISYKDVQKLVYTFCKVNGIEHPFNRERLTFFFLEAPQSNAVGSKTRRAFNADSSVTFNTLMLWNAS